VSNSIVTKSSEEIRVEAEKLTDEICDLLPNRTKLAVALVWQSLGKQIRELSPKDWATAEKILSEEFDA